MSDLNELTVTEQALDAIDALDKGLRHPAYAAVHHADLAEEKQIPKIETLVADPECAPEVVADWEAVKGEYEALVQQLRDIHATWNAENPDYTSLPE